MLEKNYLTKEGYEKLIEELKGLKEKLPQVLERIKEAVQQGDLSENAEYSTAVDEKNFIETTIGDIESSLKNVEIIKEGGKQKGGQIRQVRHGSKIKIFFDNEKNFNFTVVGTGEVDILKNKTISFDSPLGKAIRGKKVGDICTVKAPHKRYEVKILDIQ